MMKQHVKRFKSAIRLNRNVARSTLGLRWIVANIWMIDNIEIDPQQVGDPLLDINPAIAATNQRGIYSDRAPDMRNVVANVRVRKCSVTKSCHH